jgi:glycosyltransferase involved in cell wall biosynthesis
VGQRPGPTPTVVMLPWPDRFEDFFDKIDVSFETFRDELASGWLFGYIEALQAAGVRVVLYYFSAQVDRPLHFVHRPTGAAVRILPTPWMHLKLRGANDRLWPRLKLLRSLESYVATPLRYLARALKADDCGAILCQEYEYARFDVVALFGRLLRLPVYATFQGGDRTRHWIEHLPRRLALRVCAGLIVASQSERRRVRDRYGVPSSRIGSIPNPFDVDRWRPSEQAPGRAELGIPQSACVVTWQGRVEIDKKGLDVLLEAWPRLCHPRVGQPPLLLLVGDGQDGEAFRAMVAAAPAGTVQWVDRYVMDREELWRYLAAADVYVFPSRREGFAIAVVEAMACGLPVVAADALGVVDALGEGDESAGVVVPRADPQALAAALGTVIADEGLRAKLGARGRWRAQRFSLTTVGAELRDFLFPPGPRPARPGPAGETST